MRIKAIQHLLLFFSCHISFGFQKTPYDLTVLKQSREEVALHQAQANRQISDFETLLRDVWDFCQCEALGITPVTKDVEQFIRAVQDEMGMTSYCIEIRKMSNFAQKAIGRHNAFVIPSFFDGWLHYMYISEDWFKTLPQDEQRFLIGHELAHIKQRHVRKRIFFFLASVILIGTGRTLLENHSQVIREHPTTVFNNENFTLLYKTFLSWCPRFIILSLNCWFSRICEKEADCVAADVLNNAKSGAELMANLKLQIKDPKSRFTIKRIIAALLKTRPFCYFKGLMHSHPTLTKRIKYLTEYAKKQGQEVAIIT